MIGNRDEKVIKAFGRNLKAARLQKGWSLRRLALEADMDHGTIRSIETGQSNPGLTTIIALARALELPAATLLPQ